MWRVTAQFQAHDGSTSTRMWSFDLPKDTHWSTQVMDDGKAMAISQCARVHIRCADWVTAVWADEQTEEQ